MRLQEDTQGHATSGTRAGYVSLVGRPNAGKSTLLNRFLGERLSIVTPKAQTTWRRVTGILSTDTAQMIFLDTPGLLDPRDLLQESMLASALDAMEEADVVLLVLDAAAEWGTGALMEMAELLRRRPPVPFLAALNKIDAAEEPDVERLARWVREKLGGEPHPLSAVRGTGLEPLLRRLEELLPPGPFLYPPDEIARDPVRFFAAEMIRESVFQRYRQEIPYSVFCRIEEFREDDDPLYIQAHLFVERESQKRILIGKGGASIRDLGTEARKKIESFLGRPVYLDLWVKVLQDWRKKRGHLKRLGFSVPDRSPRAGRA